ncbi:MAG: non-homologous end-joining DNA ligase [Tuberibacillus sp.]
MEPLIPFEPIRAEKVPSGNQWTHQVKWDGVRMLTYWDGEKVELYNRKKNKRSNHYPELTDIQSYTDAQSIILDGEVIALDNQGNPSFHEVMRRDGIRNTEKVARMKNIVPVTYMVFDILYLNGQSLIDKPLSERQTLLQSFVTPNANIQIVPSFSGGEALFKTVKSHQLEGIVSKQLDSTYGLGEKDGRWIKIKNYLDIDAVIGGFTLSGGTVNAVLLGLYDQNNKLHYIGHAGTGKFTVKDWRDLTALLTPLEIKEMPFVNRPERIKTAKWVKPVHVVKVQFIEWTTGGTLRQPSIQALVERAPLSCLYE